MSRLKGGPLSSARENTILVRAGKYEEKYVRDGFYFEPDHGDTVCRACLGRLIAAELVGRFYGVARPGQAAWFNDDPQADHDVSPRCLAPAFKIDGKEVGCGRHLHGWLTEYGARDELAAFEEGGFDIRNHEHCYLWTRCESAFGTESDEMRRLHSVAAEGRS